MATQELVKTEAALTAVNTFCDAIPVAGEFNIQINGTWVGTLSVQKKFVSDADIVGEATATTADKLVDTSTAGVRPGDWVHNTTDDTHAMITAIDSETTLSINGDIMESGEAYVIERWWNLAEPGEFNENAGVIGKEIEGGVHYRIGFTAYTSGTAYVRISK